MTQEVTIVLLSAITGLLSALVFVVKGTMKAQQRQADAYEQNMRTMIGLFERSVVTFEAFQEEHAELHRGLVSAQQEMSKLLDNIDQRIRNLEKKLA